MGPPGALCLSAGLLQLPCARGGRAGEADCPLCGTLGVSGGKPMAAHPRGCHMGICERPGRCHRIRYAVGGRKRRQFCIELYCTFWLLIGSFCDCHFRYNRHKEHNYGCPRANCRFATSKFHKAFPFRHLLCLNKMLRNCYILLQMYCSKVTLLCQIC